MTDKGKRVTRWMIPPMQTLEADVPVPFVVEAVVPGQVSVSLMPGATVLIAPDGTVSNAHGTPLFRLADAKSEGRDG